MHVENKPGPPTNKGPSMLGAKRHRQTGLVSDEQRTAP